MEKIHSHHLQPVEPLEKMLVNQIVTARWRLRRALTAEVGEVALSVDGGKRRLERVCRRHSNG